MRKIVLTVAVLSVLCACSYAQNAPSQQVVTPDPTIGLLRKQRTKIGQAVNEEGILVRARAKSYPAVEGMGNSKLNLQAISVTGKAKGFMLSIFDKRDTDFGFWSTYQKFVGSPESATVYIDDDEGKRLVAALRDMLKSAESKSKDEEEILTFNGTDAYQIVLTGIKGDQLFRLFCGPQQIRFTFRKWKDVEQLANTIDTAAQWLSGQ